MRWFCVLGGLGLASGCPDRPIDEVMPTQQGTVTKAILLSADIDILFVIDNSLSTLDKQKVFSANFPRFVQALDAFPTGRPNLHMAVVSTTVDIGVGGFGPGCPSPAPRDNGLFQITPRIDNCAPPDGFFLSDIKNPDVGRTTNYDRTKPQTLDQALGCIAVLGSNGCGFEAPLEAMKRALDGSRPENAGFLRDGAYLAVIILTDEDDASVRDRAVFSLPADQVGGQDDFRVQPMFAYSCDRPISSTQPGIYQNCVVRTDSYLETPDHYFQFLTTVKDPSQIVTAVIAAPPPGVFSNDDPPQTARTPDIRTGDLALNGNDATLALLDSCSATINGTAAIGRPAVRLASFVHEYGDRGRFYTVCQPDYSAALADIGKTLFNAISPCLEGDIDPRDVDPVDPGLQLQCTASDVQNAGGAHETSSLIPACAMQDATTPAPGGARPCYWIGQDAAACPAPGSGLEVKFVRDQSPPTGTTVKIECAFVAR